MMKTRKECFITGLPIAGEMQPDYVNGLSLIWYVIEINNNRIGLSICQSLYNDLVWPESDISNYLREHRSIIIGEFARDGFKSLHRKTFHLDCDTKGKANHHNLKTFIEDLLIKGDYPKSRREKYKMIVKHLQKSQSFDGAEIIIKRTVDYYGKFYIASFDELAFYLREMQRKDLITYFEDNDKVQFTMYGLEYLDTLEKAADLNIELNEVENFDIALSFAGEDRQYVEQVAKKLIELGIKVFYDSYEQSSLWGKDLYQHLNDVYSKKSKYCIVFVSASYAQKLWTKHELKSAQARAFKEFKEYILPARFDLTELPGLNETVHYIDCNTVTPNEIAMLAAKKLGKI